MNKNVDGTNELSTEKEAEIIDRVAQFAVKSGFGSIAVLYLQSFRSLAWVTGQFARVFVEPYVPVYEKETNLMLEVFGKIENVERLAVRIEEIQRLAPRKDHDEKSNLHCKARGCITWIASKAARVRKRLDHSA